ncbi:MAG: hypothetical protein ACN2B6_05560 [Rickettsiales bacterium]
MSKAKPNYPELGNWKTGNMMKKVYPGHSQTWNNRLEKFAIFMEAELQLHEGYSEPEAKKKVDKEYVGWRTTQNGKDALAISPRGQAILLPMLPALIQEGWDTPHTYHNKTGISDEVAKRQFENIRDDLAEDIRRQYKDAGQELDDTEINELVSHNLIGDRKPRRGPTTIAAGPDVQRILGEEEIPKMEDNWVTPKMMAKKDGGTTKFWREKMQEEAPALAQIMHETLGVSLADANHMVDETMIGIRIPKTGGEPRFAASVIGRRELLEKYGDEIKR